MSAATRVRVSIFGPTRAARARLADALMTRPEFEVLGDHGLESDAVSICVSRRPDLVVIDAADRPPVLALVDDIMSRAPTPILAIAPAASIEHHRHALLEHGVVDVFADSGDQGIVELLRTAQIVARIRVVTRRAPAGRTRLAVVPDPKSTERTVHSGIVAIGASTGGPAVVAEILRGLPSPFPVPVVVVVHIGPSFGYSFADWLGTFSKNPVHQAADGMELLDGHVYVSPPERHLVVDGNLLALTREAERHSCRPSVDVLFESVASTYGARAVGCLLTGIGRDGAQGLARMRRAGAFTIAQDEDSCAVFGMPREAIALGAADAVAPPSRIVSLLSARAALLASTPGMSAPSVAGAGG